MAKEFDLILVPYENARGMAATKEALSLIKPGSKVGVLIGPEGDFSKEEIIFAIDNGFKPITLGRERLRTETAAVVATVIVSTINKL